ncbi:lysylphosphatidylglycerol synthase domain-containing protein [Thermodesulfobacteriota bacterium]
MLNFFFNCLLALIILLYIFLIHDKSIPVLFFFFSTLGAVLFYIVFFAPSVPESNRAFWNKIARTINSWDQIRNDKSILYRFSLLILIRALLLGVALKLSFSVSELYISYPNALLLGIIGSFAILISITPGGFGVVEGILLLSSPLVGTGSEEMLVAALIHRTMFVFTLLLLWPFAWACLRYLKGGNHISTPPPNGSSHTGQADSFSIND